MQGSVNNNVIDDINCTYSITQIWKYHESCLAMPEKLLFVIYLS